MEVILAPGDIMQTDYFSSADYHAGLAWLTVRLHDWHVLLPRGCSPVPKIATIRPVTDHEEPDGWRWRLELGDWHLPIKHRQIVGHHPRLPSPGTQHDRILRLYVRKAFHAHRHAEHHANPVPQPHAVLGLRVVR